VTPRSSPDKSRPRARRGAEQTKLRFLLATEQIFCSKGYEGTTIRAVATRARANLGTLQHYWGSKRALFRDLFERRFTPLKTEQLRRLRGIEAQCSAGVQPAASEVLQTLIALTFDTGAPPVDDSAVPVVDDEAARARGSLRKLFGRALMDPSLVVVADMNRIFEEPIVLFLDLMRRACPTLTVAELDWRINCILGAHLFSLVHTERMGRFFGKDVQVPDEQAAQWVLDFFLHGLNTRRQC
jgi:AcrR family transcriptional regulator